MNDDLRRALQDPGYTPPRQDYEEVLTLLSHPELGKQAERALLSAGLPAAMYAAENLERLGNEPALVRLVGRALQTHDAPELLGALTRALTGPEVPLRRHAAMALGRSGRRAAEPALLACLSTPDPKLLRSVIEALGKVGGEAALSEFAALTPPANLAQVFERARLMLERSAGRPESRSDAFVLDRVQPAPVPIVLECRAGLEAFLADEAASLGAVSSGRGQISVRYRGTLRPLLELRLASSVAIAWPLAAGASPDSVLGALVDARLVASLAAWCEGVLRFRLEWKGAGHRRADTWHIAQRLREANAALLNDPVQAPWVVEVQSKPTPRLLLKPIGAPDLRFGYRTRDVPAASHPTLAAALARIGGARADDVVWDPFTGSGVELIERAKLGPLRSLHGSDLDERALAAARENAERAGIANIDLQKADARSHRVPGLSLVLSNPPMGRRVLRERGLSEVLCEVVKNVAEQLVVGGRMVWLSPFADATARAAADAGLRVERLGPVDLGGFTADLQRYVR